MKLILKLAVEIELMCMNNKQLVRIITSSISEHFYFKSQVKIWDYEGI